MQTEQNCYYSISEVFGHVSIWFFFPLFIILVISQDANADTRHFRMGLWNNPTGADADVAFFVEGQPQPVGNSVMMISSWQKADFAIHWENLVLQQQYDLARIEAVVVDEPYWTALGTPTWSNPCRDHRKAIMQAEERHLDDVAFAIKQRSPQIRFWINFSEPEMRWMMDSLCPADLIRSYIDVISMDVYWKSFSLGLKRYYSWIIAHRSASQQIALVPGTFFRDGKDDQLQQAALLKGYFNYANRLNRRCDLPLGPTGVTRRSDGCLVWIVMGWLGQTWKDTSGVTWRGEGDPRSHVLRAVWQTQKHFPLHKP